MKKPVFIAALTALQKQSELDQKNERLLTEVFPDADNLLYPNHYLANILVAILQEEMRDTFQKKLGMTWIEYFINELNFGLNINNKIHHDLSTSEKLYDFLVQQKTNN